MKTIVPTLRNSLAPSTNISFSWFVMTCSMFLVVPKWEHRDFGEQRIVARVSKVCSTTRIFFLSKSCSQSLVLRNWFCANFVHIQVLVKMSWTVWWFRFNYHQSFKHQSDLIRILSSSVCEVISELELGSSSTVFQPSKNALCHLKTCVRGLDLYKF